MHAYYACLSNSNVQKCYVHGVVVSPSNRVLTKHDPILREGPSLGMLSPEMTHSKKNALEHTALSSWLHSK